MTMAELAAGCHDSSTATLTHRGGKILFFEYPLELLDTGGRRGFEFSPGVMVEGDDINLCPKTSQELDQLSSCLRGIIHAPEEKILEGNPVTPRQFQAAAGL